MIAAGVYRSTESAENSRNTRRGHTLTSPIHTTIHCLQFMAIPLLRQQNMRKTNISFLNPNIDNSYKNPFRRLYTKKWIQFSPRNTRQSLGHRIRSHLMVRHGSGVHSTGMGGRGRAVGQVVGKWCTGVRHWDHGVNWWSMNTNYIPNDWICWRRRSTDAICSGTK